MARVLQNDGAITPRQERGGGWPGMAFALSALVLIGVILAIEALLAFRVWVQLSGEPLQSAGLRFVYGLTSDLVSPFAAFETTTPVDPNGVLELSTLVAIEGYLVVGALIFGALWVTRNLLATFTIGTGTRQARREAEVARQTA